MKFRKTTSRLPFWSAWKFPCRLFLKLKCKVKSINEERGGALKRIITFLSVVIFLLAGCTEKEETVTDTTDEKLPVVAESEEVIKKLSSDLAGFHFVADWLTNTEVLFVEKDESAYFLKTFHINTGEVTVLYEDTSIIVDVLVHPLKDKILIHTSDSSESGIVKVLSHTGFIEHEVTIESSELEIEWNDMEPSLILFTAFYEDWSYDVFLYDGIENDLQLFPLDNPFPKWLGSEKIVASNFDNHSNVPADLKLYDRTGEPQITGQENVVYFDTYQKSLLLIQMNDEDEATYSLLNQDLSTLSTWKVSVALNDAAWVFPEIDWLPNEQLILARDDHQDESEQVYELVGVTDDEQVILAGDIPEGPVRCSPDGEKCLIGYAFEHLIDLKNHDKIDWLIFTE